MARTYAARRRSTARILASPEHLAYMWAMDKVLTLSDQVTLTTREREDDWWALMRCLWKAKLGLHSNTGQWCYRRWKYLQSTTKGRARGVRKLKTIIKGLP